MSILDELIETANRLCKNLEIASQNEKIFNDNICLAFEQYNWETYRMLNNIKEIKEYCGK